ncbi:D-alanyl-D-alanine carboxypeptidase/D-alanyl-D-alanine endopeptidase [Paragemmobacter straminiformis]|uniref:D-alanyl-D-alanine carboxypeptidase/D-alanyl-D-alanine-endopeptidase n=1 Tax=Paragemmobacter straminiformis TaxID=2045119 RepID=A0A842I986_9RHOB|nr:D-alanyl-D-alanine carboxypeptidase/D-alanyl-D-alanine-endopeptidase [Gemmobacter straminiformis]MBC2836400.1 D-alanyl-D-alanine carboxypeptidase/D-alanyl-D-alanine-endopeptidase [Gemmobacter straminiformis]
MISRRGVLAGLLAGVAAPVLAEGAAPSAADLIATAQLGGDVGFCIADAATGKVLEALHGDHALPPASTAKVITSLFALERLGEGHRFATRVLATGPVSGGVVQGDIVLAGTGDPELDTDDLGDLAARLAQAGVRGIAGGFYVYDAALPYIDEIASDQPEHVGYNPAISGLNLNYNRVNFEWKRDGGGYAVQMDARGERFVPLVRMARMKVVQRDAPLFTYQAQRGAEDWTVSRDALGKGGSRWLPVRIPGLYAGEVFQTLCAAQGIALPEARVAGAVPQGASVLAEVAGDPLPDVLRRMLRWSTNLTAEVMGLASSGQGGLAASGGAMADWAQARLGVRARFVDHSGLGAASRIAPVEMVRALVAAQGTPMGAPLKAVLRDLGMKGEDGAAIESPVKVIGKTGTLNFASGLVGYIQPPKGREMAFAIYCADTGRRDGLSRAEREQPPGGKAWLRRARRLQGQLIARWAGIYV